MNLTMNNYKINNFTKLKYSKVTLRKKKKRIMNKKMMTNLPNLPPPLPLQKKKKKKQRKKDMMKIRILMTTGEKMWILMTLCFTLIIQRNKMNCIKKLIGPLRYPQILR